MQIVFRERGSREPAPPTSRLACAAAATRLGAAALRFDPTMDVADTEALDRARLGERPMLAVGLHQVGTNVAFR